MTNRPNGTLYVGVTADLARRYAHIVTAIQREKSLKHWPRAWKTRLIVAQKPEWDLGLGPL